MSDINLQEKGFLLWIGMGILACLVLLTVISFLDFRTDSQHAPSGGSAVAACHMCGTQSIPQCLRCGSIMQWDSSSSMHRCPRCRRTSRVSCPSCGMAMMHAQQAAPQQTRSQPAAWFHRPGCPLIVPQAAPQQTAPQPVAWAPRPGCPLVVPQATPQPVAWPSRPATAPNYPICPQCGRRIAQVGGW